MTTNPLRQSATGLYFAAENSVILADLATKRSGATGVIYCHAHNDNASEVVDSRGFDYIKVPQAIAAAGLPVISADLGGIDTWGNATAISRIASAFTYLQAAWGVRPDRVLLIGTSMGATAAINYAQANAIAAGVVGMFPVLDMTSAPIVGNYQTLMDTAYVNHAGWTAALPTSNPANYQASLAHAPIHLLYSAGDTIVLPAVVTSFQAGAAGVAVTTQALAAAGAHVTSAMSDAEIATATSFLLAHA